MDIQNITFGDGLVLTDSILVDRFAQITGHQITRKDFATSFTWASLLDLDGFGAVGVAYINGTIADARHFQDGDDSDSIAAAIAWVAATTEGKGMVYLGPKTWSLTSTITVSSGIEIVAHKDAVLSLGFNGYAFSLNANASDIRIDHLTLDGNGNTGGLVDTAGAGQGIEITNCRIGIEGDEANSYVDGYLFNGGTNVFKDLLIEGNRMWGGSCLVNLDDTNHAVIRNNRMESAGQTTTSVVWIDLDNCDYCEISGNYAWLHDGTSPLDRAMLMDDCDYNDIRDNHFIGSRLSSVRMTDCAHNELRGNKILNGGTGNQAGDRACLVVRNSGSTGNVIEQNTISGLDAISGTVPINMEHAVVFSDNSTWGSSYATKNTLRNNLLSMQEDIPVTTGKYRISNTDSVGRPYLTHDTNNETNVGGNTICSEMTVTFSLTGGSPTETVTINGFPGVTQSGSPLRTVTFASVASLGVANQPVVTTYTTNSVTVAQADGTNLSAQPTVIKLDG